MHKIKIFLLSSIVVTAIVLVVLVYIVSSFNDKDYQQLFTQAVDNFSDYTLTIKGSFALNRSLTPALSASEIELHAKTDASFVRIGKFRIQLSLAPLLENILLINDLLLEDIQVEIQTGKAGKNSVGLSSFAPVPIIEHAILKNVQLTFNNDKQAYHLDSLVITESNTQEQIELQATGKIEAGKFNFKGFVSLLDSDNNLIDITPDTIAGLISGEQIKLRYKSKSTVAKTSMSNDLTLSFINGKPAIAGDLSMANLVLQDDDLFSKQDISNSSAHKQGAKTVNKSLFSSTAISFQVLQTVDLNLKFKINKLQVKSYQFDKINIAVLLNNGKLSVDPLSFDFAGEPVLMAAEIDARAKPELAFSIRAKNIQTAKVFGQQKTVHPRKGIFGVNAELKATGTSLHEIVSSLMGDVSFMLENETINRSELELVFLNPMGWIFSKAIAANEIHISCGLAHYEINRGIIKSKVLLMDGPKLFVRGTEDINLGKETINSLYNLQKKNILDDSILLDPFKTQVPIRVTGNLANPTVEQAPLDSLESTAERYIVAPAATIPQEILGTSLDFLVGNEKIQQSPCTKFLHN